MKIKKNYVIPSIMALTVLTASAGLASSVYASSNASSTLSMRGNRTPIVLTDAQKSEMETKIAAVKAAINAGNYDAWVTAEKAIDANSPRLQEVTSDNFKDFVARQQARESEMAQQKVKITAVETALANSDYAAWVKAEKDINANSPILTKVTESNFSRYVEAYNLQKQADSILKDLGIDRGGMMGMGRGGDRGMDHGGMGGPRHGQPADTTTNN